MLTIDNEQVDCLRYLLTFFFLFLSLVYSSSFFFLFFQAGKVGEKEGKRERERERERESNTAGGVSFVAVEEESERRMAAAGNGPAMFELSIVSKRWKEIQKRKRKKKQ